MISACACDGFVIRGSQFYVLLGYGRGFWNTDLWPRDPANLESASLLFDETRADGITYRQEVIHSLLCDGERSVGVGRERG